MARQPGREDAPSRTTRCWRSSSKTGDLSRRRDPGHHPQGHHRAARRARLLRLRLQEQGRPAAAGRHRRLPARRRTTSRRSSTPHGEEDDRARADRRRAVLGAGLQDRGRQAHGQADLHARLLRHAAGRRGRSTTARSEQDAAHRPHPAHARQPPGGARRGRAAATSWPWSGSSDTRTGDTLCCEEHPIMLETIEFPAPVMSISITPESRRRQREAGRGAAPPGRRGSDLHGRRSTTRPARRSSPAWANCTWRSSSSG